MKKMSDTKGPEIYRGEILISGLQMDQLKRQIYPATESDGFYAIPLPMVRLLVESIDFQASVIRDLNNKISRLEDTIIEIEDAKPDLNEDFIP